MRGHIAVPCGGAQRYAPCSSPLDKHSASREARAMKRHNVLCLALFGAGCSSSNPAGPVDAGSEDAATSASSSGASGSSSSSGGVSGDSGAPGDGDASSGAGLGASGDAGGLSSSSSGAGGSASSS